MDLDKVWYSHPPKTGGSSIVYAHRTINPKHPHIHRPLPSKAQLDAMEIEFSYATVTNPVDRIIDTYNYQNFPNLRKNYTFDKFVKKLAREGFHSFNFPTLYLVPQITFLKNATVEVDEIIRMENYEEDYRRVVNGIIGIKEPMPHINKTSNQYVTKVSVKQRKIIESIYKVDYEYLNY